MQYEGKNWLKKVQEEGKTEFGLVGNVIWKEKEKKDPALFNNKRTKRPGQTKKNKKIFPSHQAKECK